MIENTVVLERKALDEARGLMRCADLESVRLLKSSSTLNYDFIEEDGLIELSSKSKSSGSASTGTLRILFDLRLSGAKEENTVLEITARLEAVYRLPDEESPSLSQIRSFARSNGMLNVWPYWREFVQSITQRAGLAPLTLPLFRIVPAPSKPAQ